MSKTPAKPIYSSSDAHLLKGVVVSRDSTADMMNQAQQSSIDRADNDDYRDEDYREATNDNHS